MTDALIARTEALELPLVTEVLPNLWMGGCLHGVRLPDDFAFVVSLHPRARLEIGERTTRVEVNLYDRPVVPDERQLWDLARIVNAFRYRGRTLVHCQEGLNRSGLVTALALIEDGLSPATSIALLRDKRCSLVLCNQVFERWLLGLEARREAA